MGIRLDSGDLAYLSKRARKMLDEAGFENAKIFASGDLDEKVIWDLKMQGARIDVYGVGTKLITSDDMPALGGVYKLAAEFVDGKMIPKIKVSENPIKVTNPGYKQVYRLISKEDNKAVADLITLDEEVINENEPLTIYDPVDTWKKMTLENFHAEPLLKPIFIDGKKVYNSPTLKEIQKHHFEQMDILWDEYKRLSKPHVYKVDLSQKLYDMKRQLLENAGKGDKK